MCMKILVEHAHSSMWPDELAEVLLHSSSFADALAVVLLKCCAWVSGWDDMAVVKVASREVQRRRAMPHAKLHYEPLPQFLIGLCVEHAGLRSSCRHCFYETCRESLLLCYHRGWCNCKTAAIGETSVQRASCFASLMSVVDRRAAQRTLKYFITGHRRLIALIVRKWHRRASIQ